VKELGFVEKERIQKEIKIAGNLELWR